MIPSMIVKYPASAYAAAACATICITVVFCSRDSGFHCST
jgi:hypothetical protein